MPQLSRLPPLLVLAGPTATGKTGLSLALADTLTGEGTRAEIISADSRQVYRGLDIGTAKVNATDRARIPHHGLDLADPDVRFTVADYVRHARDALMGISGRGALAILVGGTGLYLRAVARGFDPDARPSDPAVRRRLEDDLERDGLAALVARLRRAAPETTAGIDLANPRRVLRALEVAELRGDTPAPAFLGYPGPVAWLGLDVAERPLHQRWIADRARGQFDAGLVDEAQALRERWDPGAAAFSAIGYHEAWAILDGEVDRETAIEQDAARNVAFAKRQRTWFRSEPDVTWLDPSIADPLPEALERARGLLAARR